VTIDAGYGDALTVDEVLARYEQRARVIAYEWERPHAPREDLAQEARIELWRVLREREARGEDLSEVRGLATVVLRRAVSNAAVDQRWTGTEYPRGKAKDPIRRDPRDLDHELDAGLVLAAADVLSEVELAYHEGEIYGAIRELPAAHRRYVYLKFWCGLTEAEIAAELGRTKGNVHRTWTEVIRPRLRERLSHLAGAA
jgi:RNA polymerase sigma factor (sigma-70 family)